MSRPVRQKTVHVRIVDRETGFVLFGSIRVERNRITLNPTPAVIVAGRVDAGDPPFDRMAERQLTLATLLQRRWFGVTHE